MWENWCVCSNAICWNKHAFLRHSRLSLRAKKKVNSISPFFWLPWAQFWGWDWGFSGLSHVLHISGFRELGLTAFLCLPTVNDVSVTRWRRINYVMGTQPVRRAINLGKAEMTGGAGLLTVTLGFRGCRTVSKPSLCSGFLNSTLPDFPQARSYKILYGFVWTPVPEIGHLI